MKKIIIIFLGIMILSVSFLGCSGCDTDSEYIGTYVYGSGFEECQLIIKSDEKFSYKKNNGLKDDPENFSGTYTIDKSNKDEVKITLFWRNTNTPNPKDTEVTGTFSKDGKSLVIKIYSTRTFVRA